MSPESPDRPAAAASSPLDKSAPAIRSMFARIAPRYDLLNRLLSGGTDVAWRRRAARLLAPSAGERVLDLCSGTGDLALEIHRLSGGGARVTAADFTFEMLALGRRKIAAAGVRLPEAAADGLRLPFPSGTFDAVTAAFGVRNFEDHRAGFREIARVLAPGGRFVVLEFTPEPDGPLAPAVKAYLRLVLPRLGALVSRDGGAYSYLPESMGRWPRPQELAEDLSRCGFARVEVHRLTLGLAAIHVATKDGRKR